MANLGRFFLFGTLFLIFLVVPDPLPFIDELVLGFFTVKSLFENKG